MKIFAFLFFLNLAVSFRVYDAGFDNDVFRPKERHVKIGYESSLHHYKNIYGKIKQEIEIIKNTKEQIK